MSNRRETPFLVAAVLAGVAGVIVTLAFTFFRVLDCTDGDGGVPYVARDSPRADVCHATGDGLALPPISAVLMGLALWLAWRAFTRYRSGAGTRSAVLACALLIAVPIGPIAVGAAMSIPSSHCSEEQEAADDASAGDGCAHY